MTESWTIWAGNAKRGVKICHIWTPAFLKITSFLTQIFISLAIRIHDGERINFSQGVQGKERMWTLLFHFSRSLFSLQDTPWALFACEFFPFAYDINNSSLDPISWGCGISWLTFGCVLRRKTPNWPGAVGLQHPVSRKANYFILLQLWDSLSEVLKDGFSTECFLDNKAISILRPS